MSGTIFVHFMARWWYVPTCSDKGQPYLGIDLDLGKVEGLPGDPAPIEGDPPGAGAGVRLVVGIFEHESGSAFPAWDLGLAPVRILIVDADGELIFVSEVPWQPESRLGISKAFLEGHVEPLPKESPERLEEKRKIEISGSLIQHFSK